MFYFWREATAALVPGFLCQSGRRRPENVSILSSLGDANETEKNITHPFKLFRDYSTLPIYFKEGKLGGKWRN